MRWTLLPVAAMTMAVTPVAAWQAGIDGAMTASAAGWNAGKLDAFVAIYADDAIFVTPGGLIHGRPEIADHYRPSFIAGRNRRGRLSFDLLRYRPLDDSHVILFARWHLTPGDPAKAAEHGMTTLVFEQRPEGWKVISDHSS
ncbi:SgcJ/EcaC family oxidoreductase [Sphingomonas bacterium]|uniref:YybH family protein n=1 Tax=Sphingomonas bacterium TaxID=1895847 RepID=UPI00157730E0|nr:SgcJ/EcaC family oxidoreductase [Sphingomonas bacterium]